MQTKVSTLKPFCVEQNLVNILGDSEDLHFSNTHNFRLIIGPSCH